MLIAVTVVAHIASLSENFQRIGSYSDFTVACFTANNSKFGGIHGFADIAAAGISYLTDYIIIRNDIIAVFFGYYAECTFYGRHKLFD